MASPNRHVVKKSRGSSVSSTGRQLPVREVWANSFKEEFLLMLSFLLMGNIWASLDTEFPGTVHVKDSPRAASPSEAYKNLKSNVDDTNIIQLGLTLINSVTSKAIVWQFNFKDFNLKRGDSHNAESIELLKEQGIDFQKLADDGIASELFGCFFLKYMPLFVDNVAWVGFHCGIDFAYMIKILTWKKLPAKRSHFIKLVNELLGTKIFDMKYMAKDCDGLHGGLESIADALKVERLDGNCHQAGYDSFLTMQTFQRMKKRLEQPNADFLEKYGNKIFGINTFLGVIIQEKVSPKTDHKQQDDSEKCHQVTSDLKVFRETIGWKGGADNLKHEGIKRKDNKFPSWDTRCLAFCETINHHRPNQMMVACCA